jgi:predicted RNA binding protein YcfA (HicA-like mRNA interferase family)
MGELAGYSGKEIVNKFAKIGYQVVRQLGSHMRLRHSDSGKHRPLTVPAYKEVSVGLLKRLLKEAGLSVEEFIRL